jgi:hypothetical protein
LTSMNNPAWTYKSQSRIDDAIALMAQAAALYTRVLGEDHPYTTGLIDDLAEWRDEVGAESP